MTEKRSTEWQQRTGALFDRVAAGYERCRPGYPEALVDAVVQTAGLTAASRLVEVGSGTGKGTEPFAQRGFNITCVEPGENLLQVAREKFVRYPRVSFVRSSFQNWAAPPHAFDLLFSAQAFHWIPEEVAYVRSAAALKPGGWLALFWNFYPSASSPAMEAIEEVYRRVLPEAMQRRSNDAEQIQERADAVDASGLFEPVRVSRFNWAQTYSEEEYLCLLDTYSDHMELPPDQRAALYGGIADVIRSQGGQVEKTYLAALLMAQVPPAQNDPTDAQAGSRGAG